eukprot:362234-Chlamydomonas_euryale.AAC.2
MATKSVVGSRHQQLSTRACGTGKHCRVLGKQLASRAVYQQGGGPACQWTSNAIVGRERQAKGVAARRASAGLLGVGRASRRTDRAMGKEDMHV